MLGKLLKHEFRATARVFLPFYGAMVAVAIVTRILDAFRENSYARGSVYGGVPQGIGLSITIMMICAVCIVALILTIQRFNKNLLGDEGYLMFTLPVGTDSLVFSKLTASVAWTLASIILAIAALAIAIPGFAGGFNRFFSEVLNAMFRTSTATTLGSIILLITCLLSMAWFSLSIYAANSLAMISNNRRGLAGFGFWILIAIVAQIVTTVAIRIGAELDFMDWVFRIGEDKQILFGALITFVYVLVGCVVLYFITRYMLKQKLNLE